MVFDIEATHTLEKITCLASQYRILAIQAALPTLHTSCLSSIIALHIFSGAYGRMRHMLGADKKIAGFTVNCAQPNI